VCHHRDAGRGQCGDLVGDAFAALELDGVRAALFEEPDRGLQSLLRPGLVTAEGEIGDHQRVRRPPDDSADQGKQFVDADGDGGVVAVDDVCRGITDQENRDLGIVEDPRTGVVVGGEHRPLLAFRLHLRQVMHAGDAAAGGGIGCFARHWCGGSRAINEFIGHRCLFRASSPASAGTRVGG